MFATTLTSQSDADDTDLHAEILASVQRALAKGDWSRYRSQAVDDLQAEIARQIGGATVRLCASGSMALELALRGCHLREGDEVICPALDYPGNLRAVRLLGATPVIVDSAVNRWTIDVQQVISAGSERTRAVMVSHLYGEIADVQRLRHLCDERDWKLIEDVCQTPGGKTDNRPLGSWGHASAFSFGGSKPLTAGCGGAVVIHDERMAQRIAAYSDRPSDAVPLSPLQAAILLPQWRHLDRLVLRQQQAFRSLLAACRDRTTHWQWPTESTGDQSTASFYKVPIAVVSRESQSIEHDHVGEVTRSLMHAGVAVGAPFRVHSKVVTGRGRLIGFQNAAQMVRQNILLDHRQLLGSNAAINNLAIKLIAVHDASSA